MKIIVWILFLCNAYALTGADKALLKSAGILNKTILGHDDSWSVKKSEIDVDGIEFKEQGKSLIDWSNVNHSSWLDYNQWLHERKQRDNMPDWKVRLRLSSHEETFGEIISCTGLCQIFRGESKVNAKASSRIKEGDEILTLADSSAWILLADGNLLRVSAKTSLTFNEINISNTKTFSSIRLNHGHIKTFRRASGVFVQKDLSETDLGFYPLKILKANREYFSREEYAKLDEQQRQIYLSKTNLGFYSQYKELNRNLSLIKSEVQKASELFITSPVASVKVSNGNLDMFYGVNERGYIRVKRKITGFKLNDKRATKAVVMLRGYNNKELNQLELESWYEVDKTGRELVASSIGQQFETLDLLTKRIPTIHLAREILISKKYNFIRDDQLVSKDFARHSGYRLWDSDQKNEMKRRENYLFEYTRRVETTNLNSIRKVFLKKPESFDRSFYGHSFDLYLSKLKNNYGNKKLIIPELSDSEFYIWVLKYAKN